jgi:hypothetical protein
MRITWDDQARYFSRGISNGVLYPQNSPGVPWNGLVSVTQKGDASSSPFFIDGQLVKNRLVPNAFSGTIEAFTYPDEFEPYIGIKGMYTAQNRSTFGFSWRDNREIHIVYNALAAPSNADYQTTGEQVNPVSFSWDFTTTPVKIPGGRPSAHLVVMTDFTHPGAVDALEDVLYGDSANDPSLPDPEALFELFDEFAVLVITDNHDGTWTATGPDDVVTMLDASTFQIDYDSAIFLDASTFKIHSL